MILTSHNGLTITISNIEVGFLQKSATTKGFVNAINGALKGLLHFPKESLKGVGLNNE